MAKKILYVETKIIGHREKYISALLSLNPDSLVLLPEKIEGIDSIQMIMKSGYDKERSISTYRRWIDEINNIAESEKVDVVHFLCGDELYRYFGLFLKKIKAPIVVTFHHMLFNAVRQISYKRIFKSITLGIVHTERIKDSLYECAIKNVKKIEYPIFAQPLQITKDEAKEQLGFSKGIPNIVSLGGTCAYKGLDILLEALQKVEVPFHLYVAGTPVDFDEMFIKEKTVTYTNMVSLKLKRLSEEEYSQALASADIIVLPYRFIFDGASGPMIDGVWQKKYIIGAEHGSMGSIINEYELGSTFKTENADDLAEVLTRVLLSDFKWSNKAELFRKKLTKEQFIDQNRQVYNDLCSSNMVGE